MMRLLWIWLGCNLLGLVNSHAGEKIVQITATLVPVDQVTVEGLTQVELKKELFIARNKGAQKLLQLSAVVESGKWATIRQGREFWFPEKYSEAKVYKADGDKIDYSVPVAGSSFSNTSIILPTSPTQMKRIDLGAHLKVRPTIKEDGLIYIEGELNDVVFEGLSEEALPITAKTGQLIKGKQEHELLVSRIDKPLFHKFNKEFGVMLPYATGNTESSKRFRNAQTKYDYLIPVQLGYNAFGAQGKIDLGKIKHGKKGIIQSTVDKAYSKAEILTDALIRRNNESPANRRNAILVLEVKKIAPVHADEKNTQAGTPLTYRVETKFIESFKPLIIDKPLMSFAEFQALSKEIASTDGTDIMTAPPINIYPGKSGTIQLIQELVFPTLYEQPKAIASIDFENAKPLEFETRKMGSIFDVTAFTQNNNRIGLKVQASSTQFEGMLNYGNPIMQLKSGGLVKKIKPTVKSENKVTAPVFPFRGSETEIVIPNDSVVAVTMIHDQFNQNNEKSRLVKIGQPKTEEVAIARYLTVFMHVKTQ